MAKIAFIGLGVMGYTEAGHLSAAGHQVTVYNRTSSKAVAWAEQHIGEDRPTPREAANGAETVCLCVGNDDDVKGVVYGDDGALAGIGSGAILVDHTTASLGMARELEVRPAEQGIRFLDAPVSDGQAGAENGVLTIMVGGEPDTFKTAKPARDTCAQAVTLMGPAGTGQLTKAANQIAIAGLVQALSEALNFAMRAGLDGRQVIDVISKGAAGSWQIENRGHTMVDDQLDFGFAVDWMRKGLGIALKEGQATNSLMPVTALLEQFYQ